MLDVIVHVQVQEPEHRIHVHRAGVPPMIENVFAKAGVLGRPKEGHQPRPVERRPHHEQQRHETSRHDTGGEHADDPDQVAAGLPHDPAMQLERDVPGDVGVKSITRMAHDPANQRRHAGEAEQVDGPRPNVDRSGEHDLRIASDDDRVAVVANVRPPPHRGFAQQHERGREIHQFIEPRGAKRRAVATFVPPRIGCAAVQSAVDDEGRDRPPRTERNPCPASRTHEQHEPEHDIDAGAEIRPLMKFGKPSRVDRRAVPLGVGKASFDRALRLGPGERVVPSRRRHQSMISRSCRMRGLTTSSRSAGRSSGDASAASPHRARPTMKPEPPAFTATSTCRR